MSDRFDFLELDNAKPLAARRAPLRRAPAPSAPAPPTVDPSRSFTWTLVEIIGGPGTAAGQFAAPAGLAVDPHGNLYVADAYNHRVQKITPEVDVYVLGKRGTGPGEFLNPQAVVTDGGLGFYVLEQGGCRIQRFGPNGEWQGAFGFRGSSRGDMLAPMAMARGPCGCLFVADSGNNRIVKWSPQDVFLDCFPPLPAAGVQGTAAHPFEAGNPRSGGSGRSGVQENGLKPEHLASLARPQGIAVDAAGRIWVAETLRHRVLIFDALFRPLGSLGQAGRPAESAGECTDQGSRRTVPLGQFEEPQDVVVTPDGCVLVADTGNDRVQVFDRNGRPLQAIGQGQGAGAKPDALKAPSGLAIRGEDELYVADTGNHRVLRLVRK
jgi:DNA-binding beta-propeller fold protein YncE